MLVDGFSPPSSSALASSTVLSSSPMLLNGRKKPLGISIRLGTVRGLLLDQQQEPPPTRRLTNPGISASDTTIRRPPSTSLASSRTSNEDGGDNSKDVPTVARLYGAMNIPTLFVGIPTAAAIISTVRSKSLPRLFQQHVIGACIGSLVFLPMVVGSIRSRFDAIKKKTATPSAGATATNSPSSSRRNILIRHISTHLYLSYAAAISFLISFISIYTHKNNIGKPHITSLHSRLGVGSMMVWIGAYVVAQVKVWKPQYKKYGSGGNILKFLSKYEPNLLWASKLHTKLGTIGAALMVATVGSGITLTGFGVTAFSKITRLALLVGVLSMEGYILLPSIKEYMNRKKR